MRRTAALLLMIGLALAVRAAEPSFAGRSLKEWIADLDAKDVLVREEALEVLPEFGSDAKPATAKLVKLYETDAPSVRYRAALALWRIDGRTEPALAALTEALKTGSRSKRMQAVPLLMQLGRPASELAPRVLDLMLTESDYNVQIQVQQVLSQFGDEAVPALRDAIGKARGEQRIQLLTLVQNLGPACKGVLPAIDPLRKEPDPRTRLLAARTIFNLDPQNKDVLADLIQAGNSTDQVLRREALQAALSLPLRPKELAPLYRGFLKDEDLTQRCRAAAALYDADPTSLKETLPIVRKVLQDGPNHTWTMAIYALAWFGPAAKDALPDLEKMLKQPDGRNYGYTIVQVCRAIGPDTIPLLIDVMEDPQAYYRPQAQQTLGAFGPDCLPKLRPLLQHKNPQIRVAAVDVIQRLGVAGRAAVPDIAKCVKDEDTAIRDRALSILDGLGANAKDAVPALREFVGDSKQNEESRFRAIDALGKIGPEARPAIADIEPHLKHAAALNRCRAAVALMRINPERKADLLKLFLAPLRERKATPGLTGAYLIQMLASLDAPRAEVMAELMEFVKNQPPDGLLQIAQNINSYYPDAAEATPVLRELWKNPAPSVRLEAAVGLSRRKELASETVPLLVDQLRKMSANERIRILDAVAYYAADAKSVVPTLVDLWRSDTAVEPRFRTATTILQIDPEQITVRDWVREQFRSGSAPYSRQQAARVLAKVDPGYEKLRPALEHWTKEGNVTSSAVGLEFLGLLGEHGLRSVPLLKAALKDPHPLKRVRAAYSLWQIEKRAEDVLPMLIAVLGETDPLPSMQMYAGYVPAPLRYSAQQAALQLGEIGPAAKAAIPALRQAQMSADESLRQSATNALRKIETAK